MDNADVVGHLTGMVKGWAWWKVTITFTIFIIAYKLPAIITALAGYRKVTITGEKQSSLLVARVADRVAKKERKASRVPVVKGKKK